MGYAVGAICYAQASDAAAAHCGLMRGVTAAGVVSCDAVSVDETGAATVTMQTVAGAIVSSDTHVTQLPGCEPQGLEYWAPALGLWWAALIALVCARMLIRNFNSRVTQ